MSEPATASTEPRVTASASEGPYLGLRTYEESDANRYFGREDIVAELARMVKRAALTVLFGVSGTGKSSLIRAGLFPILRDDLHLPVSIRLDFTGKQRDLRAQVRAAISAELDKHRVDAARPSDGMSFREYFARNAWWNPRNRLLTPFLVFDQFEEIFTVGRDHADEIAALMDELADVVELRALDLDAQLDIVAPRPRVMFALREDFLAHLEEFRTRMPSLAGNRLRLTRMNGVQALRAVIDPARDIVDERTARKIVYFVADGAEQAGAIRTDRPLDSLEVEPAILSLVCEQLDLQRRQHGLPKITEEQLTKQGGKIVERFYEGAFEDVSPAVRALVEEDLVTSDGYRTTMAKAAALDMPGVTHADLQKLLDKKILREEVRFGSLHVELIHDRLTKIASQGRARRREAEQDAARAAKLRQRLRYVLFGLFGIVIICVGILIGIARARERAHSRELAGELATTLVRESRGALLRGDVARAAERLIEAKRHFQKARVKQLPPEYTLLLDRALIELSGRVQHVETGSSIACLRIVVADARQDGPQLLTCGPDGTIRRWRDSSMQQELASNIPAAAVKSVYASDSGKLVLVLRRDGSGRLRMLAEQDDQIDFQSPETFPLDQVQQTEQMQLPANPRMPVTRDTRTPAPSRAAPRRTVAPTQPAGPPAPPPIAERSPTDTASGAAAANPPPAKPATDWRACIAPDDSAFAVWAPDVVGIRAWNVKTRLRVEHSDLAEVEPVEVQCLADGKLALVTKQHEIVLVDADGSPVRGAKPLRGREIGVTRDARTIAYAQQGPTFGANLVLVDTRGDWSAGEPVPAPTPAEIEFSADGGQLMVISRERERVFVGVWSTQKRELQFALERADAKAHLVSSPSRSALVVASGHRVEAWDTKTWQSLGTVTFEFELETDVHARWVGGELLVAAASETTASLRAIEMPEWADRSIVRAPEQIGVWISGLHFGQQWQRTAGRWTVALQPTALVLRDRGREVARLRHDGSVVDARIAAAPGGGNLRIAVLRKDESVAVYDDKLAELARPHADGARGIRWSAQQELITLGAWQTRVWTADGAPVAALDAVATDAALVYAPRRALWTCAQQRCTAWDLNTRQPLTWIATDAAGRLPLALDARLVSTGNTVLGASGSFAFLLPVIPGDGATPTGPVRELRYFGKDLFVGGAASGDLVVSPNQRWRISAGASLAANVEGSIAAGDGEELKLGTPAAYGAGTAKSVWTARAPLAAVRAQGTWIGTVDTAFGLTLVERDNLIRGGTTSAGATVDVQTAGSRAVFSPNGNRWAFVTPRQTIQVRKRADGSSSGDYDLGGELPDAVLLPDESSPIVAAVTPSGLMIWNKPGNYAALRPGAYDEALLGADGKYLVALRGYDADLLRIDPGTGTLELLKTVPAVAIALDDTGTRVATDNGDGFVEIHVLTDLREKPNNRHDLQDLAPEIVFAPRGGKHVWIPQSQTLLRLQEGGAPMRTIANAMDCVFGGDGNHAGCVFGEKDEIFAQQIEISTGKRIGSPYPLSRLPDRMVACSGHGDARIGLGLVAGNTTTFLVWDPKAPTAPPLKISLRDVVACRLGFEASIWALVDNGLLVERSFATGDALVTHGPATLLDSVTTASGALYAATSVPGSHTHITGVDKTMQVRDDKLDGVVLAIFDGDREVIGVVQEEKRNAVKIWSLPISGEPRRTLDVAPSPVTALAVVGRARRLAVGHEDGVVEVWEQTGNKAAFVLPGHGSAVRHIAIDSADRWIATSYEDGTVNLWPVVDREVRREPLVRLDARGRRAGAPAIVFEPGEPPFLITGNADGDVRKWRLGGELPVDAEALVRRARVDAGAPR